MYTCPTELREVLAAGNAASTILVARHVAFDVLRGDMLRKGNVLTAELESGEEIAIVDMDSLHSACVSADSILVANSNGFRAPVRFALLS